MTSAIIISICLLLIIAYLFDISAPKTKIPPVLLLLIVGWAVRQISDFLGWHIPNLSPILPIIGTIGLILIVLEGALDIELDRSKLPFVGRSILMAFIPIIIFSFGLAWAFKCFSGVSLRVGLLNAIPFSVISSAIAISSAKNLIDKDREFITYESSLSDIFAVVFFNFIIRNEIINLNAIGEFFSQTAMIFAVTLIATLLLAFILRNNKHRVKFLPIILLIILIYNIAKTYHLPALIFIFVLGLFMANLNRFERFRLIKRLRPDILVKEVDKLRELTNEITFSIRALFFLLFGYLIETYELLNTNTMIWTVLIVAGIFVIRFIFLKIFKQKIMPLIFIAPRGLITILLFISIPFGQKINIVNNSLIIQVIIITSIITTIGVILDKKSVSDKAVN